MCNNKNSILGKIKWDYNYSDSELLAIINNKSSDSNVRRCFFIKSLQTLTWQELVALWGISECDRLYDDKTRKGLFPRQLREVYDGVFELLRNKTLSHTERSPEELERFKTTVLFNRRNRIKQRVL